METAIILSSIAIILTAITAGFSVLAYAKVVGMEKSTHKVQFVPQNDMTGPTGPELAKKFEKLYAE